MFLLFKWPGGTSVMVLCYINISAEVIFEIGLSEVHDASVEQQDNQLRICSEDFNHLKIDVRAFSHVC